MRNAALKVGNILVNNTSFIEGQTLFVNKPIPDEVLQKKELPWLQIDGLPVTENEYASNKKLFELSGCQLNLYSDSNRYLDEQLNKLESLLSIHDYECFFYDQDYIPDWKIKRLIMRVQTNQKVREF
ncbi:MAG: hypothetical protein ABF908_12240 [Lentilactobacillus diolivorans]